PDRRLHSFITLETPHVQERRRSRPRRPAIRGIPRRIDARVNDFPALPRDPTPHQVVSGAVRHRVNPRPPRHPRAPPPRRPPPRQAAENLVEVDLGAAGMRILAVVPVDQQDPHSAPYSRATASSTPFTNAGALAPANQWASFTASSITTRGGVAPSASSA